MCKRLFLLILISVTASATRAATVPMNVGATPRPARDFTNTYYAGNRAPLVPAEFIKLPIGSIQPQGWLSAILHLQAKGMFGHLEELSKWLDFSHSAWASTNGAGQWGWEELPYWLKGYGDLGYVLHDETIITHARKWIDAMLASQQPDGYFGPVADRTGLEGHPDIWPHMLMLNALQSYYEYSSDARALNFMSNYFRWLGTLPAADFGRGYWPKIRFGDTMETAYWLYNRTGDTNVLTVARRIHENMADWTSGVINWHNVNFAQGFREPGIYYLQSGDRKFLEAAENNYQLAMDKYGQFPGGGFAADENARPGYTGPKQGFETCGMVEFMHSFELMSRISGDVVWADRCEDVAFNSLPAAFTPDMKGLHYLTCPNQVALDATNHSPGIENQGTMFSYSAGEVYRCCQHNAGCGWPYFAEELWLATPDNGLCLSLYAPSTVSAKVGAGSTVKIIEETRYPFEGAIRLKIETAKPVTFPLYLRVPSWCAKPVLSVNHKHIALQCEGLSYAVVERSWKSGDIVEWTLPMPVEIKIWSKQHNAASVSRGPLSYSLEISEQWTRIGGTDAFPDWSVTPAKPWNYALALDKAKPLVIHRVYPKDGENPFTPENSPVEIEMQAKRVAAWKLDEYGMAANPPASPISSEENSRRISLIPMGAARLRISSFPVAQ